MTPATRNATVNVNLELKKFLDSRTASQSYLDVNLNGEFKSLPEISAIIPTYNRAPNAPGNDVNPLGWCLESLVNQKKSGLSEIIVIDDASVDNTKDVVDFFTKQSKIPIKYLRNSKQLGSSISRNRAVAESKNDFILFMDDDCIASEYFAFGANYTMMNLPDDVASLQMAVYHRKNKPSSGSMKDIGTLDLETGVMKGNFDKFPAEYLENREGIFLNPSLEIINPFEIQHSAGVFLIKKDIYEKIGGFPEFFTWSNGYREEAHVALKLKKEKKRIFFSPDPKFHCVHLKYGARSPNLVEEIEGEPKLNQRISMSNAYSSGTGNRVKADTWFKDYILSTHFTLSCMSESASQKFAEQTYQDFVLNNELCVSGVETRITNANRRDKIFFSAIKESKDLLDTNGYSSPQSL